MQLKFNITLLFIFFFLGQTIKGATKYSCLPISLEKLGAVANDGLDDSEAFMKLLSIVENKKGNYLVQLPEGEITIDKPVVNKNLIGSVTFEGKDKTKIVFGVKGQLILSARNSQFKLRKSANSNLLNIEIETRPGFKVNKGDLIHLSSESIFETGWNYKENDIHRVSKIKGNSITLETPLIFNYLIEEEKVNGTIFQNFELKFSNISFSGSSVWDAFPASNSFIVLSGLAVEINNIRFDYQGLKRFKHIGISLQACERIKFLDILLENFLYGVLINYSRNVTANNAIAKYCRHAFVPSQATYNVTISNLKGYNCNSVIDSHQSFLVNYKNVVDTLATEFPNCRALGTKIENAKFYVLPSAKQEVCYWSIQSLTKEYEYFYGQYDTEFYNVEWVSANPSRMNGLTSYGCRNLIVDKCKTHNVAFYGQEKWLNQVSISNSNIGMVNMDSQRVLIENTILDGLLFKNAPFVFKFRGSGNSKIDRVIVKNYNDSITSLFGYFVNISPSSMVISNSHIGKLKGWTNSFIYPGKKYSGLQFYNTSFSNLNQKVPLELELKKPNSRN